MQFPKKPETKKLPERSNVQRFLGFGFHKLQIKDYEIKTFQGKNGNPESYSVTFTGGTEDIENFKGFNDVHYQVCKFKPYVVPIIDSEELIMLGNEISDRGDSVSKGTDESRALYSYKSIQTLLLIANAVGVGDEASALQTEGVYYYIKEVCELIKKGGFAYFEIKEEDSKNVVTGKVYSNNTLNWDMVVPVSDVSEVSVEDKTYTVRKSDGKLYIYSPTKYNYIKLVESMPNDTINDVDSTASDVVIEDMTEDLPF